MLRTGRERRHAVRELGPSSDDRPPRVWYGPLGTKRYEARDCAVVVAGEKLACRFAEGTGRGYAVVVSVGEQESAWYDTSLSYAPPSLKSYVTEWEELDPLSGGADTQGGEWIVIEGTDFGANATSAIDRVTYGLEGDEFVACASRASCGCHVEESHKTIRCAMVEGAGGALRFVVTVDGQTSTVTTKRSAPPAPSTLSLIHISEPTRPY